MKFLSAQPDNDYFVWQLEVQCYNFRKYDLEKDMLILLGYSKKYGVNPNAKRFAEKTKAKVFFVADTRIETSYIASIKPHLVLKFYMQNKIVEPIFYHDSDIIFRSQPNFDVFPDMNKIYLSDTTSYIGAKYIRSKGEDMLKGMCKIVGIDEKIVIDNQKNSGGAQYYFNKPVDYKFWGKVEHDSNKLYQYMIETSKKNPIKYPIQAWCAEMWATLWNIWLLGIETEVVDELKFCFPTDLIEDAQNVKILHNAGVTKENDNLFYKGDFIDKAPYGVDFSHVNKDYCSYLYVNEINERCIYEKVN